MKIDVEELAKGVLFGVIYASIAVLSISFFATIPKSYYNAKLYNENFGTNYTMAEMFFNGDEIMKIHEEKVPQRPYEVNANLNLGAK